MENILILSNREEFRNWLQLNHNRENQCWIKELKRGKPINDNFFYYLDAVEEALCFGWIDSVYKKVDGVLYQKFSPRQKNSNWTILNIARTIRLTQLGLMTEDGLKVIPKTPIILDKDVIEDIKTAGVYDIFSSFPLLYQQIRISNLSSMKGYSMDHYQKSFDNFVSKTKDHKMVGEWNDYGRLIGIEIK